MQIIGNDIIRNGAGIAFWEGFSKSCETQVINNIILENTIGIQSVNDFTPNCLFNNVWKNGISNYEGFVPANGNISVDPLFVDAANGDYHLQSTSPCIDAGWNDFAGERDMDGNQRIFDGNRDGTSIVDIGAYEFIPPLPTIIEPRRLLLTTMGKIKSGETHLFQNYPNPFNPDTWIPYTLAEQTHVVIEIHSATGQLIRTLDLGNKPAGIYFSKEKAAHWGGQNEAGEQVGSAAYFYTIRAGDFTATKKMVIAE